MLNLFLSKQLTINKCTCLDCTNITRFFCTVYTDSTTFGSLWHTHPLLVQKQTLDVSAPWLWTLEVRVHGLYNY